MNSLWQYLLIYLLVAVEGAGVTLAAAALAGTGMLTPLWVFLAAGTGNLTGDLCWYLLGYFGQFDRVLRWFPRFAKFQPQIDRFRAQVNHHAPKMLFIAKLSLGVMSIPTLVAAGMARVPLWRIAPVQILGEAIWTGGLVLIGLYLGQYITQFERGLQIASIAAGAILLLIVLWLLRKWLSSNESSQ